MKKLIKTILIITLCLLFSSCTAEQNDKVVMPFSAYECNGKNYQMVYDEFSRVGFKEIELKELADIKFGILAKEGEVAEVSIGMNNKFKKMRKYQ